MTDEQAPNGTAEALKGEVLEGLPGGAPMPTPTPAPQQAPPDGVFVVVEYGEKGVNVKDVVTSGSTRATEISDILSFGLKVHKQKNGLT